MGSAPIEVNEWGGKGKAGTEGEVRLWYSCQRSLSQHLWSSALRWSYRVFLNWDEEPGSNILESTLDWMCTSGGGMTIGKLALCRQCQFPETGLSREIVKLYVVPYQLWLIHQRKEEGKDMGKNTKKSTPFIFFGISGFRVSRDNIFPQNAQQCWSVAQAFCRVSVKTISESLHGRDQPCQISVKCTSTHSRRVKLPTL